MNQGGGWHRRVRSFFRSGALGVEGLGEVAAAGRSGGLDMS